MHAALEWLKHALGYNIGGVITVQTLLVTIVALPILNELVSRRKSVTAWSIIQAVGNAAQGTPLYKIPVLTQVIDLMRTPEDLKRLPPKPMTLPPPPLASEPTPPPTTTPEGGAK